MINTTLGSYVSMMKSDIIPVQGHDPFDTLIENCQDQNLPKPLRFCHIAGSIDTTNLGACEIVEAQWNGVKENELYTEYRDGKTDLMVWRHMGLTDAQRELVVATVVSHCGNAYGYGKIATALLDKLFGDRVFFRKLSRDPDMPDCSALWALGYDAIGYRFLGMNPITVEPDDIYKHVSTHSEWKCIKPLGLL